MQTNATIKDIIDAVLSLIGYIIPFLATLSLLIFLWGGVRFVYSAGEAERHNRDKEVMLWGLIAMFILFSIGGILYLLQGILIPPEYWSSQEGASQGTGNNVVHCSDQYIADGYIDSSGFCIPYAGR